MKNSNVVSGVIGGAFFAIPYLALSVPILPSLAIGAAAFAAGELVLTKEQKEFNARNASLNKLLEKARKDNNHISKMINQIDIEDVRNDLSEITKTVEKIINTVSSKPDKRKKLNNFFEYYLPVTVKLVDRYDEIENQKLNNKESKEFYKNTANMLKEINDVFKKMLDSLYESDILDANVEMKVLNSMLKSDGLDKNAIEVKEDE